MSPTIEREPHHDLPKFGAASEPQPRNKRAEPRKKQMNAPWHQSMMKLAIHFCFGLIILHSILIGLMGAVKLVDDKFSHANHNLQMLSDTRDAQLEFVSRRMTNTLYSGPGLSKKFGETHVQCYERGLDYIYAGFGGLDFMKYADYSHDVEQWVHEECSRLFFTPQDPQKRFSVDSDIDTLRYRARKLIEKIGVRVAEDSRTFNAWYDNQVMATSKTIKRVFGDGAAKLWVDLLTWRMPKITEDKPTIPSPPTQPAEPDMIECTEDAIFGHPPPCARVIEKHPDWVITRGSHNLGRLEYAPSALHRPEVKFRETIQIARSRAAILQRTVGYWKTANKLTMMLSYVIMAFTYPAVFGTAIREALNTPSRSIPLSDRTPAALRNSFVFWTSLLLSTLLFRSALYGDWISVSPTNRIWIGVSAGIGLLLMYLVPNNPPWPTVWGLSAVLREYRTVREQIKKESGDGTETVRELVNKYLTPLKKPETAAEAPTTPAQRARSLSITSQATASDKKRTFTPNSTLQEDIAATVAAERAEAGWAAESKQDEHMDESFEQIQGQHENATNSPDLETQSSVSTVSFTNSELREMASNLRPIEVPAYAESSVSSDSEMDDMSFPLEGTHSNAATDASSDTSKNDTAEHNITAEDDSEDDTVDVTIVPDAVGDARMVDTSRVGDDIVEITMTEPTSNDRGHDLVLTYEPSEVSEDDESSEDDEDDKDVEDEDDEDDEDVGDDEATTDKVTTSEPASAEHEFSMDGDLDEDDDTFQETETPGEEPVQVACPEDTGAESGSDWSVVSDSP